MPNHRIINNHSAIACLEDVVSHAHTFRTLLEEKIKSLPDYQTPLAGGGDEPEPENNSWYRHELAALNRMEAQATESLQEVPSEGYPVTEIHLFGNGLVSATDGTQQVNEVQVSWIATILDNLKFRGVDLSTVKIWMPNGMIFNEIYKMTPAAWLDMFSECK